MTNETSIQQRKNAELVARYDPKGPEDKDETFSVKRRAVVLENGKYVIKTIRSEE